MHNSICHGRKRTQLIGTDGEAINSFRGAMDMHDADVHNVMVNKILHQHTGTITTLAVATTGDGTEYQIEVVDIVGFATNNYIHIEDGGQEPTHPKIIDITGNIFTLDRKIDLPHTIGATITKSILDLKTTAGSISSPVIFYTAPLAGEVWHIERLLFSMAHSSAGDLGKFGNIANGLPNGLIIRIRENGKYRTLSVWKTAGDMKTDMYDVDFPPRSGGGGDYGTTGRWTFKKSGTVLELHGDTGDRIEALVQDSLLTLGFLHVNVQGHFNDQ